MSELCGYEKATKNPQKNTKTHEIEHIPLISYVELTFFTISSNCPVQQFAENVKLMNDYPISSRFSSKVTKTVTFGGVGCLQAWKSPDEVKKMNHRGR